jgi:cytochrome c oxidase assembly protein subunit 15
MRDSRRYGAAALAVGLGTAVCMWTVGFALRLPPAWAPSALVLVLMLACLVGGGAVAARRTGAGIRAGAAAAVVASAANLLVLGSLLSGDRPEAVVPAALLWVPGSLLLGAACGAAGALLTGRVAAPERPGSWTGALARVAAAATLVLVLIGGLVTSHEAGLAVVDWPNSYGYNMFLYPLSRMVGGIYYEHAHRLFGTLVGLTTLTLFVRLLVVEPRGWVKAAGGAAVLLVVAQGVLGGLRVTGHFTMASTPDATRPSLALAMVHGVTGQLFFAWMACLAVFTSRTWIERIGRTVAPSARAERIAAAAVVAAVLVQLLLGVRVRHTGDGTMLHITFAVVVFLFVGFAGIRLLGGFFAVPALRRATGALLGIALGQVVLGTVAFLAVTRRGGEGTPDMLEVVATTLHQTTGAALLGSAAVLLALTSRLLVRPEPAE